MSYTDLPLSEHISTKAKVQHIAKLLWLFQCQCFLLCDSHSPQCLSIVGSSVTLSILYPSPFNFSLPFHNNNTSISPCLQPSKLSLTSAPSLVFLYPSLLSGWEPWQASNCLQCWSDLYSYHQHAAADPSRHADYLLWRGDRHGEHSCHRKSDTGPCWEIQCSQYTLKKKTFKYSLLHLCQVQGLHKNDPFIYSLVKDHKM